EKSGVPFSSEIPSAPSRSGQPRHPREQQPSGSTLPPAADRSARRGSISTGGCSSGRTTLIHTDYHLHTPSGGHGEPSHLPNSASFGLKPSRAVSHTTPLEAGGAALLPSPVP
ncbi:unnamed protein product, partial [Ectocarpus sp. 4 AP-2014]